MRLLVLACSVVLLTACSPEPQYQTRTMPNGQTVKFLGITKMHSTSYGSWLVLNYQTDLAITDSRALSNEADQIWPYFVHEVERAGLDVGTIKAHSAPEGFVFTHSRAYEFVYKKKLDGTWSRVDDLK